MWEITLSPIAKNNKQLNDPKIIANEKELHAALMLLGNEIKQKVIYNRTAKNEFIVTIKEKE